MIIKIYLNIFLAVSLVILSACESNIQFSETDEKEKCVVKKIRSQEVCVAKKNTNFFYKRNKK